MKILKYLIIFSTLFITTIASAGTLVVNSNQSGESSKAAFDAYVDAFRAAHPEVTVVVNEFEHEAYKTAIRNFLTAEAPDVAVWFAGNRMKFFVDQGLFMDVSDVWADAGLNDSMSSTRNCKPCDHACQGHVSKLTMLPNSKHWKTKSPALKKKLPN